MKKILKKGDKVLILSGNYKGTKSIITKISLKNDKIIVKNVNVVKKHIKPGVKNPKGGIIKKEAYIHISNVMKLEEKKSCIYSNKNIGVGIKDKGKEEGIKIGIKDKGKEEGIKIGIKDKGKEEGIKIGIKDKGKVKI
ncbi:50S ribosomal protein L24 [Blattabacterium cuenoti]|uniref:50S ribosomal protein L24 n=1 Tax=Blattabacterium cuenoti TaxID=1653831 RepID=UPI00163D3671|nr:50S ribosomal protein L24 [Blattabacterium cuenoti]